MTRYIHTLGLKPVHPFPARMAASLAWSELKRTTDKSLRVLDPMAGSGTTLAVARKLGHRAIGFDTDPLARLIGETWCSNVEPESVRRKCVEIVERAEALYRRTNARNAFPDAADRETRDFIRYWFDADNRRQLYALATSISRLHDPSIKRTLWCAFSRLIITKANGASLAMDLSHSRPHKSFDHAPLKPLPSFESSVDRVLGNAPFSAESKQPAIQYVDGDARQISLRKNSVDVIITSPPYANAIDYVRCHKFSLVWMGYTIPNLRQLRSSNVGCEVGADSETAVEHLQTAFRRMGMVDGLPRRDRRILLRYVADMDSVLSEMSRVLKPGGRVKLVVGDSTVRGVFISNSTAIRTLAKHHGLNHQATVRRPLPDNRRYLPPPSSQDTTATLHSRMREEAILTFSS